MLTSESSAFKALVFFAVLTSAQHLIGQDSETPEGTIRSQETPSMTELQNLTTNALRSGKQEQAIAYVKQLVKQFPTSSQAMLIAGDTLLRCGQPKESIPYFDRYLKDQPEALPYLWQRGIALYFAGDYQGGVKQFEVHRRVNPNDVENAAWHFLCLTKAESFQKASQLVLPAPGDPRIPMEEVLSMLKTGDTELVKKRMQSVPEKTTARERADFYGFFYLGLYADAKGDSEDALGWLKKSAADAPHHYMGDVARVYQQYLEKETKQ